MTNNFIKTGLLTVFLAFTGAITKAQTAVEYLTIIGDQYTEISEANWSYTKAVSHNKSGRKIDKKRKQLIKTTKEAQSTIKGLKAFNGSTAYRDSVLEYLNMSYSVLVNDYAKIMDLDEIKEQSYDMMEAYLLAQKTASNKLEAAGDMVDREQKVFCANNNITLTEEKSELGKKMEIANEVYDYYNPIYLIFFKANIQETKMIIALGANDMNAVEQSRQSMKIYAEEGLAKLKEIKSYKGDNTLKLACQKMLQYYVDEADNKVPALVNYVLEKDKFDKYNQAFQKKSNKTQADIDKYNQKVADINTGANDYNQNNNELNNKRSELINNWNNSVAKFTDKHIPN